MIIWEYRTVRASMNASETFKEIWEAGQQGWELVGPIGYDIYLKRPKEVEDAIHR